MIDTSLMLWWHWHWESNVKSTILWDNELTILWDNDSWIQRISTCRQHFCNNMHVANQTQRSEMKLIKRLQQCCFNSQCVFQFFIDESLFYLPMLHHPMLCTIPCCTKLNRKNKWMKPKIKMKPMLFAFFRDFCFTLFRL